MIDIWKYQDAKTVKITDIDGNSFIGNVIDVTDTEERSDIEEKEDGITINCEGRYIEFYQSEIQNIEIVV